MGEFQNKVILITGSSAGIGAGIAEYLAARGARLSLTGRDEKKLDTVRQKCLQAGLKPSDVLTQTGEVTDTTFQNQLVTSTVDKFGQLDVLVNNAGVALITASVLSDPGMDGYHTVMDTNLTAPVALTKLAIPHLLRTKGNIVNISSVSALETAIGMGAYGLSKAALDFFTKQLALELAPKGVRVNSVNPGRVKTEIYRSLRMDATQYAKACEASGAKTPIGRIGRAEEIARAVAFLASDQSGFITGEILVVDGGVRFVAGAFRPKKINP